MYGWICGRMHRLRQLSLHLQKMLATCPSLFGWILALLLIVGCRNARCVLDLRITCYRLSSHISSQMEIDYLANEPPRHLRSRWAVPRERPTTVQGIHKGNTAWPSVHASPTDLTRLHVFSYCCSFRFTIQTHTCEIGAQRSVPGGLNFSGTLL